MDKIGVNWKFVNEKSKGTIPIFVSRHVSLGRSDNLGWTEQIFLVNTYVCGQVIRYSIHIDMNNL